jgi:hypothetical protein
MLNLDQLRVAVAAAKRRFDQLRQKYPELDQRECPAYKAYLVLSLPGGQVPTDASPKDILTKLPAMVVDDSTKLQALAILSRLGAVERSGDTGIKTQQLLQQWEQLALQLKYNGACQVEIRFGNLNYDLIWKLQADDLVDRELTPQTNASIRIVLGTLAQFAEEV